MRKNNLSGFTLIDSLIGLTIITLFSSLYLMISHEIYQQNVQDHLRLEQSRIKYEVVANAKNKKP
ncbi:type II secretion system protein [Lentilactobacillus sp. SPB1-3]|uniref:Type II secretion system protein n=1 Tax=Lentilactobacillus terminaliae TaxID=3003483 RepID=A0ACD5DCA1_9LACO|nr:type II secretion system protein [Lentilactobacillus sp. SPB1-3]MCZ0977340.1 type II secretion system protein [Lentilactobacillus sp. SPB1-3]